MFKKLRSIPNPLTKLGDLKKYGLGVALVLDVISYASNRYDQYKKGELASYIKEKVLQEDPSQDVKED